MEIPRTDFGIETETFFKNLPYDEKKEMLHFHQYIINRFMVDKKRRGVMIYHSMGFGKTILAVSITEAYRRLDPTRKAIILLPKSLQNNFADTVRNYMQTAATTDTESADESAIDTVEEHYKFVSLNSSNMYSQIGKIDKTQEEIEFEKNLGLLTDKIGDGSLENSVLVIDEFHNLSNAITNGSKNGLNLYNKIMKTKDIKLIFLTGTPIVNNPFEMVCVMNMLKGRQLFPENIRDFISFFVDYHSYTIKNKEKFQNRIIGLISYYGDEYFDGRKPNFPIELPMKVEQVPMSKEQFARYLEMREIEKKEEARKFSRPQGDNSQFNQKGTASSSYRIRSRQVSNFLLPSEAVVYRGNKIVDKNISRIPMATYKNLDVYSPKNKQILNNINKHKGQLQLVFSQFTSAEGLGVFGKILEAHGFEKWIMDEQELIKLRPARGRKQSKKSHHLSMESEAETAVEIPENAYPSEIPENAAANGINSEAESNARDISSSSDSSDSESGDESHSGGDVHQLELLSDEDMGFIENSDNHKLTTIRNKKGGVAKQTSHGSTRKSPRKYAIYSGDVLPSIRNKLVEIFNSKENMHGEVLEVLLISNQTGGLGLDLHGVRAIHIMEPFWNWALIQQIIARGVRYNSHKDFPKEEQTVQPYLYLSVFPESYTAHSQDEDSKTTTDMHLYTEARNNRKLNDSFLMTLIEASIDCSIHHKRLSQVIQKKINCYMCAPTGEPLFHADFYKDMGDEHNPCKQYTPKKIDTQELIFTPPDGGEPQKYYYTLPAGSAPDIKIFEYNARLEGYIPLKPSHPYYSDLMRVILKI